MVQCATAQVLRWAAKRAGEVGIDRDGQDISDASVKVEGHAGQATYSAFPD